MFRSVLVANRGEIAVRICRTLRKLGIRSVVVASIPDRRSLAVRTADAHVILDGYSAAESYLDVEPVLAAAKAEGCEAIHPGYGFLSERADFAERCAKEGIVFVGPSPAVLRGLGDKAAARRLAVANGVPVVPGWDGPDDDATLLREGAVLGFPLMVKARGGGGGRGMREVFSAAELPEALASARREAVAAFGDPGLLLERLVTRAHHVEVQVVADTHGNVIHLGERDCSVQRRHQKLIEESPSPMVDAVLRGELTASALRIAGAIGYVNAGTFEFLVGEPAGASGRRPYYFLEVNPRLQVEHPVTEMVTGLDLVELQLRVAAGEPLPIRQEDVRFSGHAIEFRINAEDPWDDFKPSSGRITAMTVVVIPGDDDIIRSASRNDAGYDEGDVVPPQYDSLVMKRIVWGPNREVAMARGAAAVEGRLDGVATNASLHQVVLRESAFREGGAHIGWLEERLPEWTSSRGLSDELWAAAALGLVLCPPEWAALNTDASAFVGVAGWMGAGFPSLWLSDGHRVRHAEVEVVLAGAATVTLDGRRIDCRWGGGRPEEVRVGPDGRVLRLVDEMFRTAEIEVEDGDQRPARFWPAPPPPLPRRAHSAAGGVTAVVAPLSGTVASVAVREGDQVVEGQLLLLLEAMKMEHRITAPSAGVVRRLAVAAGEVVREGDVLAELG